MHTSRRSRVIRALVWLGVLGIVTLIGLRNWHTGRVDAASERFRAALAPVLERGDPVSLSDLHAGRRDGAADDVGNGASAIVEALAALEYAAGDETTWPAGPWSLDDDELDALDAEAMDELAGFIAARSSYFDAVDAATRAPRIAFERADDLSLLDPSFDMTSIVRMTQLWRARVRTAARPDVRLDTLASMLRLAHRIECRTTIDHFLAAFVAQQAAAEARRAVSLGELDAAAVGEQLDAELRGEFLPRFRDVVMASRAFSLTIADHVVDLPGVDDARTSPIFHEVEEEFRDQVIWSAAGPTVIDGAAELVEKTERILAAGSDDPRALADVISDVTLSPRAARERSVLPWVAAQQSMERGTDLELRRAYASLAQTDCSLRLTRVAVAAARQHASTGSWPSSPDDLVAAFPDGVPTDPWSGGAFEITREGATGIRVASAGARASSLPEADGDVLEWTVAEE